MNIGKLIFLMKYLHRGVVASTTVLVPIGGDLGGGIICIVISGDHLGKIFYWGQSNEVDSDDF